MFIICGDTTLCILLDGVSAFIGIKNKKRVANFCFVFSKLLVILEIIAIGYIVLISVL